MSKQLTKTPLNHSINLISIVALLPVSMAAFAQNNIINELDPLVVTATKNYTKSSSLVAQTKVITQQELTRHQAQNVLDVLKTQAGISHYTNGSSDKVSNFYMRGFDGSAILVLVDGIPFTSLTTGTPALGNLSVNEIERIEILYGASGASLYGANAVGGVVQIFTKKGSKSNDNLNAHLGIGSHKRYSYGASANFSNNNTHLRLSASHDRTDGINAVVTPYVANQRDNDGFDTTSVGANASHRFDKIELGAGILASKSKVAYDDTFTKNASSDIYAKQQAAIANVYASFDYQPNSQVYLQYGQSQDKSDNYSDGKNTGKYHSTQEQINLNLNHTLTVGKLIGGIEYQKQKVDSDTAYAQTERNNQGYHIGYQANVANIDVQAFVRHDKSSVYGNTTTYNAGLAYRIMPNLRFGVNYATGFKAPSFSQLYYPNGGNPNLNPEKSNNTEAFVEFVQDHHKTRLTGYHSKVTDLIAGWPVQNINKANITGVSLTSDWILGKHLAGVHYDYQEANNTTPINGQKSKINLTIRPEHKGMIYTGYRGDNFDVRAEYQRIGGYYAGNNHSDKVRGYGLVNLSGSYELSPNISINTRINNLLNKKYTTIESFGTRYNEDGINFYTAINFSY